MADENNAASSTANAVPIEEATVAAIAANDPARYMELENAREIAERTGKPITEVPAASTKPDQNPAAEPGNDKPIQERKSKTGEDRKSELAQEIQDLLAKRAALRAEVEAKPGDKKADPPPPAEIKAGPKAAEGKDKAPVEPKLEDFATYAEYQAADRKYTRELVQFETRQTMAAERTAQAASEQNKALEQSWLKKRQEAESEHADWADVALSQNTPITPAMDGFILDSEIGPRILYRLGENGSAEGKRIAALSPYAAVRALVAIEAELSAAKKDPPVKRTTAAPPPATDLGGRNTEPGDPILAALNRGDAGEYIRLSNARDAKLRRAA